MNLNHKIKLVYIYIYKFFFEMYVWYILVIRTTWLLDKYYGVNKKLTPNVSTWIWYRSGENSWVPHKKW